MEKKVSLDEQISPVKPDLSWEAWAIKQIQQSLADANSGQAGVKHADVFKTLRKRLENLKADKMP